MEPEQMSEKEVIKAIERIESIDKAKEVMDAEKANLRAHLFKTFDEAEEYKKFKFDNDGYRGRVIERLKKNLVVLGRIYIRDSHRIEDGEIYEKGCKTEYRSKDYIKTLLREWPCIMVRIKNQDMREGFHKFMTFFESCEEEIRTLTSDVTLEVKVKPKTIYLVSEGGRYSDEAVKKMVVNKLFITGDYWGGNIKLNDPTGTAYDLNNLILGQLKDEIEQVRKKVDGMLAHRAAFEKQVEDVGNECFRKWLVLKEI